MGILKFSYVLRYLQVSVTFFGDNIVLFSDILSSQKIYLLLILWIFTIFLFFFKASFKFTEYLYQHFTRDWLIREIKIVVKNVTGRSIIGFELGSSGVIDRRSKPWKSLSSNKNVEFRWTISYHREGRVHLHKVALVNTK